MKLFRKLLVKLLGLKGYLKLVSRTYIKMMRQGKLQGQFEELRFVKRIVQPGYHILDIGANLGYYSWFMAEAMGEKGKLLAVEPIPLFAEVWKKNMQVYPAVRVELVNCALGADPKDKVKMAIPVVDGVVRHGLTKVVEEGESLESYLEFEVPMRVGDEVVNTAGMTALDYVKCDVEGFEQFVIPSLGETIDKFRPLFQIELSGRANRENVADYLVNKGYEISILADGKLVAVQKNNIFNFEQDFYFVPSEGKDKYIHLFR